MVHGTSTTIYCTAADRNDQELTYRWYMPDMELFADGEVIFTAPQVDGIYTIACKVTNEDGLSDSVSVNIEVVERMPFPPVIKRIKAEPRKSRPGDVIELFCEAVDFYDEPLSYSWTAAQGDIAGTDMVVSWSVPAEEGNYYITCLVTNPGGLFARDSVRIMVSNYSPEPQGERVAFYPLRGNASDFSGNNLHGTPREGITWTTDVHGRSDHAAYFNGRTANILLPPSGILNFTGSLSVAMFLNIDEFTTHEQHPVSHGSWEHRYKISVSGNRLRFTVNTNDGIMDLDTETEIEPDRWYHVVAAYNGRDMEIWLNAELDAFTSHTGSIGQSPANLLFGQNLPGNKDYNYKGSMAMTSIYNFGLTPALIQENMLEDLKVIRLPEGQELLLFPNPTGSREIKAMFDTGGADIAALQVFDLRGRLVFNDIINLPGEDGIPVDIEFPYPLPSGFYTLRITAGSMILSSTFVVIP